MTDIQWAEWIRATGGTGATLLAVFVVGLMRKWWVLGWQYEEKASEGIEWKAMAMRQTTNTGKGIDAAVRAMETQR